MGGELERTDLRPFFFQVIEIGKKEGLFSDKKLEEIREKGAEMTVELARRHYSVVSQAHLWQSSYNLLGILSVSFLSQFGHDIVSAASFIKEKPSENMVKIFRRGWALIESIVKARKEFYDSLTPERDLCEEISAEPDLDWFGWQRLSQIREETLFLKKEREYHQWVIKKWCRKPDPELARWDEENAYHDMKKRERRQEIVNTVIFSLLISEAPFAPLAFKDVERVIKELFDLDEFRKRIRAMSLMLPEGWNDLFDRDVVVLCSKVIPQMKKHLEKEDFQLAINWMTSFLFLVAEGEDL